LNILKERAHAFSGLTSAMNYQLRLLCVSVVPLHAETFIVRIDSAQA